MYKILGVSLPFRDIDNQLGLCCHPMVLIVVDTPRFYEKIGIFGNCVKSINSTDQIKAILRQSRSTKQLNDLYPFKAPEFVVIFKFKLILADYQLVQRCPSPPQTISHFRHRFSPWQRHHDAPNLAGILTTFRSNTPSFASCNKVTNLVVNSPKLFSCRLGVWSAIVQQPLKLHSGLKGSWQRCAPPSGNFTNSDLCCTITLPQQRPLVDYFWTNCFKPRINLKSSMKNSEELTKSQLLKPMNCFRVVMMELSTLTCEFSFQLNSSSFERQFLSGTNVHLTPRPSLMLDPGSNLRAS